MHASYEVLSLKEQVIVHPVCQQHQNPNRLEAEKIVTTLQHIHICQTHPGNSSVLVAPKGHCRDFHAQGLHRRLVTILGMLTFADVITICNSIRFEQKAALSAQDQQCQLLQTFTASQRLLQMLFWNNIKLEVCLA